MEEAHSDEIHLASFPDPRALDDFPAEVQAEEEGDIDVRSQKVGDVEREKDVEAVDEDKQGRPERSPDGEPRLMWDAMVNKRIKTANITTNLEAAVVHSLRAIETLSLHALVYRDLSVSGDAIPKIPLTVSEECDVHGPPSEEASHC